MKTKKSDSLKKIKSRLLADGLGLVVPINIEALCVGAETAAIFKPSPYNFSMLPDRKNPGAYLGEKVKSGGLEKLETGVHLHWALPDGMTKGERTQEKTGNIQFPSVPDRWLVTRVYTNLTDPLKPVNKVKSWVIESNYMAEKMPDADRPSIAVPYRDSASEQQYRFLGRVQEYETWLKKFLKKDKSDTGEYVTGLSAVGYGTTEFSASYQNCRSLFGFCDTATDLDKLGSGNLLLSYNVIGWYHDLTTDPLTQLPLQMYPEDFDNLLSKISNPNDRKFVSEFYTISERDGVSQYRKSMKRGDDKQPEGVYVLKPKINSDDHSKLVLIFSSVGYDFLDAVLNRCNWSLPSGTLKNPVTVTHSLLSGQIRGIVFNKKTSLVQEIKPTINIAIGNTAYEALAALIASITKNKDLPNVELLLNALQLGELKGIKDAAELNVLERLQLAIHTATYQSSEGGYLWQISLENKDKEGSGEVSIANKLADKLNKLNLLQQDYDNAASEIDTLRGQIFMDWYRFMLVFHPAPLDPNHGMTVNDMAKMIEGEIKNLDEKVKNHTTSAIDQLVQDINTALSDAYVLERVSAPRFWQPLEPVVLFQGEHINPPQRYGGDGRFMENDTLLCRLSDQLITTLTIPVNTVGNNQQWIFDKNNTPSLSTSIPLDYSEQIHGMFTEFNLLNPQVIAACSITLGSTFKFNELVTKVASARNGFSEPPIAQTIPAKIVDDMQQIITATDYNFLLSLYEEKGDQYQLQRPVDQLSGRDKLRLTYIFISTSQGWGSDLIFTRIAPSKVYFVDWNGNPWLPFSLSWHVNYYPYAPVRADTTYDDQFIVREFKLGDVTLEPRNPVTVPVDFQSYSNFIFMSPHATENFQEQIQRFVRTHKDDPLDPEFQAILDNMKDFPPILSQALNGLNSAMLMRDEVLQLQVKDPVALGGYAVFTNNRVRPAVSDMNRMAPAPGNYFNPIRAGVMRISSLTIVDVFGRNINIQMPDKTIIANDLTSKGLPANFAYLPPRLVQSSRLEFRWLAADNNALEMNTHPATTPICGWLIANHLEYSLWIYTNGCKPLGSIILTEDGKRVIWQSVPGGDGFGMPIGKYFDEGPGKTANKELKNFALALYNKGDASYLKAFMRANDLTFSLVQPQNYKQMGSTAVLMGSPIAVAQARIDMELNGLPAYNQSWESMKKEVNKGAAKTDNGFTKVKFPVRLGKMEQVDDGLLGYFKQGNYNHYYALNTDAPTERVTVPDETNILLNLDPASNSQLVTILFDPRGSIHATCGVLPVKEISIPPDMFADDLMNLEMTFLTTPIITNESTLAFPTPGVGGGKWSWVENELNQWSESVEISPVDDRANLLDPPQIIKEGWMKLNLSDK